jgi:hypothetical protein
MRNWAVVVVALLAAGALPAARDAAAAEDESQRLDVLIVGDTADAEVGASVAVDVGHVQSALRLGVPAGRRTITVLVGEAATPERIKAHYEALPPAGGATLLFYYSGHGAWADTGHYLRMNGGKILDRARLLEAMQAKSPRLAVVLTDCCSLYVGETALYALPAPDPDVFRDLFFRHRGVVDATAARKGQEAVGDTLLGGFFTHALAMALTGAPKAELDATRDGVVSWDELLAVVSRDTASAFRRAHPRGVEIKGRKVPGQNPHLFGVGAPPAAPIRSPIRLGVKIEPGADGLVLTEVVHGSAAAWIELRPGDRLVSVRVPLDDGDERSFELRTAEDLQRAMATAGPSRLVVLSVAAKGSSEVEERWVRLGP